MRLVPDVLIRHIINEQRVLGAEGGDNGDSLRHVGDGGSSMRDITTLE